MLNKILVLICILFLGTTTFQHSTYNYITNIKYEQSTNSTYTNHCWNCDNNISSNTCDRCDQCGWYICNNCGQCYWDCLRTKSEVNQSDLSTAGTLIIVGIIIVVVILIKLKNHFHEK